MIGKYPLPERYKELLPWSEITKLREIQEQEFLKIPLWDEYHELLQQHAPAIESLLASPLRAKDGDFFTLQLDRETNFEEKQFLKSVTESLLPWRKGPYTLFGEEIDAEWRSDFKWERMKPHLPEMRGRRIADIGGNNGYHMFRMLDHDPELVAGFDPSGRCYKQFELFQMFLQDERLCFELFGVEHMGLFKDFFDVVFCLGVIYHRRDPYTMCRTLYDSMRKDGTIFMESLIYPGEESMAFCPPGRYAQMRNVWYLPTVTCLINWMKKAGFKDVVEVNTVAITVEEQRSTRLAPWQSLADFLDPNDSSKTIEGYPAPTRATIRAKK